MPYFRHAQTISGIVHQLNRRGRACAPEERALAAHQAGGDPGLGTLALAPPFQGRPRHQLTQLNRSLAAARKPGVKASGLLSVSSSDFFAPGQAF